MNNIPDMTNKADVWDQTVGVNYFYMYLALFTYDKFQLSVMINVNTYYVNYSTTLVFEVINTE